MNTNVCKNFLAVIKEDLKNLIISTKNQLPNGDNETFTLLFNSFNKMSVDHMGGDNHVYDLNNRNDLIILFSGDFTFKKALSIFKNNNNDDYYIFVNQSFGVTEHYNKITKKEVLEIFLNFSEEMAFYLLCYPYEYKELYNKLVCNYLLENEKEFI